MSRDSAWSSSSPGWESQGGGARRRSPAAADRAGGAAGVSAGSGADAVHEGTGVAEETSLLTHANIASRGKVSWCFSYIV